jgi:uncharacterized protein (DUF1786 family)
MSSVWGMTPRASVEAACREVGESNVVSSCVRIINDRDVSADFAYVLAGPASLTVLSGGEGGASGHWPRTWALRGLLYAWDRSAESAVLTCLNDDSWRVREMALKVVARRRIDEALEAVALLQREDIARVRAAAQRALVRLVQNEA